MCLGVENGHTPRCLELRVKGSGLRVKGLGFRFGLGFEVCPCQGGKGLGYWDSG